MSRLCSRFVAPSLIASFTLCLAGSAGVGHAAEPTLFQRAIGSWMGVIALLADDDAAGAGDRGAEGQRGDAGERRRGRGDRGPREWSPPRERGRGASGRPPFMRTPPMGPGMHGMPMPGLRSDMSARLDEVVERLSRIERKLDAGSRMGNPWSPRPAASRGERPQPPLAAAPTEMQERVRDMMQEGRRRMAEAQERMEQARKKFGEMEERIKKLEAEVERLKAGR